MTTVLFFFAILTAPQDRIICDLWTHALTMEAYKAACPTSALAGLRLDVLDVDTLDLLCSKPADDLPRVLEVCGLGGPLDAYVLRLVEPDFQTLVCMIQSESDITPTPVQVAEQCPQAGANYEVEYAGKREVKEAQAFACPVRNIPQGFGLYEQPFDADDLTTRDDLPLLAGQLIWNGYVTVISCDGTSGVNMHRIATPCGYASAHDDVIRWQNQFNAQIFTAATIYNVPARLLKRMMMVESQFWIFHDRGADGEIGIMQITDNGLDTLLRWDREIDPAYLSRSAEAQAWSRNVTRQMLICHHCTLQEATDHIKQTMPYYARLLAAYHCRAVTLNPALTGADEWRQTVVDYNGSGEYLAKVEQ